MSDIEFDTFRRCKVQYGEVYVQRLRTERDEALARVRALEEALKTAADDLDKAANQFEGIRQSQSVGHVPLISANPGRFAAKAERARAVLHDEGKAPS